MDFDQNCGFWWKLQILMKTTDFGLKTFSGRFKVRNCKKKHISNSIFNRTTSNTEIQGFLSEMKDYLPKKLTPIFFISCTQLTLSRPYNLIFALSTRSTLFKTIWQEFCFVLCIQLTPFKTLWPNFIICTQLTPFKTIWPNFIIVYTNDTFQDHLI